MSVKDSNTYGEYITKRDEGYHLATIGGWYGLYGDAPYLMIKSIIEHYGLPEDENICNEMIARQEAELSCKDKDSIISELKKALELISTSHEWDWTELENYGHPSGIAKAAINNIKGE